MVSQIVIRRAQERDIKGVCALGASSDVFEVNSYIRFYEEAEIAEWISKPEENILLVAVCGEQVVGFLFCKIMSHHWGLLDNFYVAPSARGTRAARDLFTNLKQLLRNRRLNYISTLVRTDNEELAALCQKIGFARQSTYIWLDQKI